MRGSDPFGSTRPKLAGFSEVSNRRPGIRSFVRAFQKSSETMGRVPDQTAASPTCMHMNERVTSTRLSGPACVHVANELVQSMEMDYLVVVQCLVAAVREKQDSPLPHPLRYRFSMRLVRHFVAGTNDRTTQLAVSTRPDMAEELQSGAVERSRARSSEMSMRSRYCQFRCARRSRKRLRVL